MRFSRDFANELKPVDILLKNPRTGDVDIVAIDVRMLILPIQSSPNDIGQDLQQPYRNRYGGILETPRTDFQDRNNVIQPITELLESQSLGAAFDIDIPAEKSGKLRITVSAVVNMSRIAIEGVDFRGNTVTETVKWKTADPNDPDDTDDPVSKATNRTYERITSATPSGFANETAAVVLWEDDTDLVVRRVLPAFGEQHLEMESVGRA